MEDLLKQLKERCLFVRREIYKIHKLAPETRIASSLSCIEVLVALYYGNILSFNSKDPDWNNRDRFIASKGHGSIAMYPILADLGYFPYEELTKACSRGSILGSIPDPIIPGYETVNGSLGHGLGVGAGMAIGLQRKKSDSMVYILVGDGELYEGANWEAIMFAGHHGLHNLVAIVDYNKICMLDYCDKIIDFNPMAEKFRAFNWNTVEVDGHDLKNVHDVLAETKLTRGNKPTAVISHSIKGKGIPKLESNTICHVMSLSPDEIDVLLQELT